MAFSVLLLFDVVAARAVGSRIEGITKIKSGKLFDYVGERFASVNVPGSEMLESEAQYGRLVEKIVREDASYFESAKIQIFQVVRSAFEVQENCVIVETSFLSKSAAFVICTYGKEKPGATTYGVGVEKLSGDKWELRFYYSRGIS